MFGRKIRVRPGFAITDWGPIFWITLHTIAHTAPMNLDSEQKEEMKIFLRLFARKLPCKKCSDHFSSYLDAHLTDETVADRDSLVILINDVHNDVNRRCGKRVYTLKEHYSFMHGTGDSAFWKTPFGLYTLSFVVMCVVFLRHHRHRVRSKSA